MKVIDYLIKANKIILTLGLYLITSNLIAEKAYSQASISSSAMFMNGGTTTTTIDPNTTITTSTVVTDPMGMQTTTTTTTNRPTTVTTTGVITSVSAESVLPRGLFFKGNLLVAPSYSTFNGSNVVSSLSIGTDGIPAIDIVPENASFNRAAAKTLLDAAAGNIMNPNLELIIGIIRAGAGVNGLD